MKTKTSFLNIRAVAALTLTLFTCSTVPSQAEPSPRGDRALASALRAGMEEKVQGELEEVFNVSASARPGNGGYLIGHPAIAAGMEEMTIEEAIQNLYSNRESIRQGAAVSLYRRHEKGEDISTARMALEHSVSESTRLLEIPVDDDAISDPDVDISRNSVRRERITHLTVYHELGIDVSPAIPALITCLTRHPSDLVRSMAASVLGLVGNNSTDVLNALITRLDRSYETERNIRRLAIRSLNSLDPERENPEVREALTRVLPLEPDALTLGKVAGMEERAQPVVHDAKNLAWGTAINWLDEQGYPKVIAWTEYDKFERGLDPDGARAAMTESGYLIDPNYYGPSQSAWVKKAGLEEVDRYGSTDAWLEDVQRKGAQLNPAKPEVQSLLVMAREAGAQILDIPFDAKRSFTRPILVMPESGERILLQLTQVWTVGLGRSLDGRLYPRSSASASEGQVLVIRSESDPAVPGFPNLVVTQLEDALSIMSFRQALSIAEMLEGETLPPLIAGLPYLDRENNYRMALFWV